MIGQYFVYFEANMSYLTASLYIYKYMGMYFNPKFNLLFTTKQYIKK